MIELKGEVAGLYRIEAFKVDAAGVEIEGSRRVAADWFPNLITDNGLNLIGSSVSWLQWCQVGSGSTPPAATDTALVSRISGSSSVNSSLQGVQASAPYFTWRRNTYRFAQGVAAGNIAEVGVGAATTGNLLSRALILDSSGNPTTIGVAADESLDVAYELRYYPPTVDREFTIALAGTEHSVVARACNVTTASMSEGWLIDVYGTSSAIPSAGWCLAYNGDIGGITSKPSGTPSAAGGVADSAYSAGSYRRDSTLTWGLGNGNLSGGIAAMMIPHGVGCYQFKFTPAIPKDATKVLALTFRHSWARRP